MRSVGASTLVAVVWCAGATGCAAWMNQGATGALQRGFEVAQQRAALAEAQVAEMAARLDKVEKLLRTQGLDGQSGSATLSGVSGELAQLRGTVEELQFETKGAREDVEQLQSDSLDQRTEVDARLAQLEQLLGVAPPAPGKVGSDNGGHSPGGTVTPPNVPVPPTNPPPAAPSAPTDTAGRLSLAEQRMTEGMQAAARVILQQALDAASSGDALVPEVQYRLAETWYNEGRFKEAARAFQVVTEKHAKSSWASWSMLRIGECFAGLGRSQDARYFYEGVLSKYPGTDAALEARSKLAE